MAWWGSIAGTASEIRRTIRTSAATYRRSLALLAPLRALRPNSDELRSLALPKHCVEKLFALLDRNKVHVSLNNHHRRRHSIRVVDRAVPHVTGSVPSRSDSRLRFAPFLLLKDLLLKSPFAYPLRVMLGAGALPRHFHWRRCCIAHQRRWSL